MKKPSSHTHQRPIWLLLDSRDFGGIESHVLQLAKGLAAFKQHVNVIFLCQHNEKHPLQKSLNDAGIHCHFLDGSFASLLHYSRQQQPQIIHSHGYKSAVFSRVLRISLFFSPLRIRFINTFHAGEIGKGKLAIYDAVDRWSAVLSHDNFSVSQRINQRVPIHTQVLNNFIDTTALKRSTGKQIALVGRLSQEKAPERFLYLAEQFPEHQFDLYGSGPLEHKLKEKASINVVFHGHQTSMESKWKDIGLLIICSLYEGLPMVALEAMGRGIPVISTPVGNMHQLIEHGKNGWITEPHQLSESLHHWLTATSQEKTRIQQQAQATIENAFSSQAIIPAVLQHYHIVPHP